MLDGVFSIDISINEKDLFEKLGNLRKNISDIGELMKIQINSEEFKFLSEKAFFMYSIKTWCELILKELQIFVPNKKNRDIREIDENKLQKYLEGQNDADKKVQSFIMAMNEFNKAWIAFKIKNQINEFVVRQELSADISIKWEKEAYVIARIVLGGDTSMLDFQPLTDDLVHWSNTRIGFISGKFTESNVFVMYLTFSKRLPPIAQKKAQEEARSASPLTPKEIKSEALKALSGTSYWFHYQRSTFGLTPMNRIEEASDSWEDVLKRLENEIEKINAWPKGLRWEISNDADAIVRLFNELIKKSKGYALLGSNRLVEKRNDDAQKGSASPIILIDEDRKRIEEINEAISEGFKETSSLSTAHPDLEKPYQKIFKIINSRDTVAIAEAIKEFYEVVGGFFLTGLPMVGGINKKETDSEVKEWKNRGKYLLKISKYVRDEMNKRIDAEWKMLRLNEASKKGAKTIINNALEKKEFDKAANIMISLLNESMDSIRHFETEKMISDAENMIKAWEKISKEVSIISIVSSSLTVVDREENQGEKRGGIDLTDRAMHIKLERVGSFASSALVLPEIGNEETIDLDNEFRQIQAMVNSDIRPSDTRILEFAAACYYKGEFDQRLA